VTFPPDAFDDERLEVLLEPDTVVSVAQIDVIDLDTYGPVRHVTQIPGLPVTFDLPPKPYGLIAKAPEYDEARVRPAIELYKPKTVTVSLTQSSAATAGQVQALEEAPARAESGSLTVRASDDLASVEVADESGRVVKVGRGEVRLDDVTPGLYHARLRTPEGTQSHRLVDVSPGEREEVVVPAPPAQHGAAVRALLERGDLTVRKDRAVEVPGIGSVAGAKLSTLLSLGATGALDDEASAIRPFLEVEGQSGAIAAIGIDGRTAEEAEDRLSRLSIRFWRFGDVVPEDTEHPRRAADLPGVGGVKHAAEPGQYWLALEGAGERPAVFALSLLPDRVTTLVIQLDTSDRLSSYEYMPARSGYLTSDPKMMRRYELIQRISLGTRLDTGEDIAEELIHEKTSDPLAACVAAYLYIRMGRSADLADPVLNLTSLFPGLSDVHVIAAEYHAALGRHDLAVPAVERALEVGVPVLAEGLARLLDALGQYRVNHPSARLVSLMQTLHIPRSIWAVWTPEELRPGRQLVP